MQVSFVLTVVGRDRPGLVEALAQIVASHGGNWLESRMAHLEGQFAGLLRVRVPAAGVEGLRNALLDLQNDGIRIVLSESGESTPGPAGPPVSLELVGHDRPGIVREIAAALAVRGINVEEFESHCTSAPMSGEVLFHARAELRVPESQSLEEVRATLEKIGNDLMVDVSLEPSA
ncbi:MAG: ACT domain-containing protein [Myxococcales bacterium]|nr:ACT domain-containing protein [Myxococcales bacterium]